MQRIKLTKGQHAIVDDDDYVALIKTSWCASDNGYAKRGTKKDGKTTIHYMHRQIMGYPDGVVDHINGNRLDNRKINLRVTNQSINGHNRHKLNANNTSGVKGVYFDASRNKWVAETWKHYRKKSKRFDTKEEAIKQRKEWDNV